MSKGNITAALRALAGVPSRATKLAAPAIEARWKADWRASKDPHGRKWKPLAPYTVRKRGSSEPILVHTGKMIGAGEVRPLRSSGLSITVSFPARLHQSGTSRMPARRLIPYMGIPASWRAILKRAVREATK